MMEDNDQLIVKCILSQFKIPATTEGLKSFLTDSKYIQERTVSGGRILGDHAGVSPMEFLYHNVLTTEQKREIYSSAYEIGSPDPLTDFRSGHFCHYLEKQGFDNTEEVVSKCKKGISKLTGIKFNVFKKKDPSLAFKILHLFCQVRRRHPQVFSFLIKDDTSKAEFDFRSSYPSTYKSDDQKEKNCANSATLMDILAQLTFTMPEKYRTAAHTLHGKISRLSEDMAIGIINSGHDFGEATPEQASDFLELSIANIISKDSDRDINAGARLDFVLYTRLVLEEYKRRAQSNKLVMDVVTGTPFPLNSLYGAQLPTFEDQDVLSFLFGKEVKIDKKLNDHSEKFIDILRVSRLEEPKLGKMNVQIIKAIILNDRSIGINIPSKVTGVNGNIPKSASSLFSKKIESWTDHPEALVNYWDYRYRMAIYALFSSLGVQKAIEEFKEERYLEFLIDVGLAKYFKEMSPHQLVEVLEVLEENPLF